MKRDDKDRIAAMLSAEDLDFIYGILEELQSELEKPENWPDLEALVGLVVGKVNNIESIKEELK